MASVSHEGSDHRKEECENGAISDEIIKKENHESSPAGECEGNSQPGKPTAEFFAERGIDGFSGTGPNGFLDIFGLFVADDVDDIVESDDAEQSVCIINNGHHGVVVAVEFVGDLFAIHVGTEDADGL